MKVIVMVLVIGMLMSCGDKATENRIKNKLVEITKINFAKNNVAVKEVQIDSLKFYEATMRMYWVDYNLKAYRKDGLKEMANGGYLNAADSAFHNKIDSLSMVADSTKNLYEVNYLVTAKVGNEALQTIQTKFLRMSDLSVVEDSVAVK